MINQVKKKLPLKEGEVGKKEGQPTADTPYLDLKVKSLLRRKIDLENFYANKHVWKVFRSAG